MRTLVTRGLLSLLAAGMLSSAARAGDGTGPKDVSKSAREFAVSAISTLVLLFFLLSSDGLFMRKIVAATPLLADKKRAIDITRQLGEKRLNDDLFVGLEARLHQRGEAPRASAPTDGERHRAKPQQRAILDPPRID